MSLTEELRALNEHKREIIPPDALAVMDAGTRELDDRGIVEQALAVGARVPRFTLPSATGEDVSIDDLLARGPVVLTFYRGAWCPYCNLALHALQADHDAITARGALLVAVSPQIPDESLSLTEKHALTFDVLSDLGSDVAKQFGIAFDLNDDLGALYDSLGFDLQRVNAGHSRTLPLPATYVIGRDGIVRWAFVQTDYTRRADPADILTALDELAKAVRPAITPAP